MTPPEAAAAGGGGGVRTRQRLALALPVAALLLAPAAAGAQSAGVSLGATALSLTEGGTATYTVMLDTAPDASCTVRVQARSNNADVTVDSSDSPLTKTLSFTSSTWNTAQTVTVSGLHDGASANDDAVIRAQGGLTRLWDEGMAGRRASSGVVVADTARLEAELDYGFGVWGGAGVMTPHLGFGCEEGGARRYRLGTRSEFGADLAVGLQANARKAPPTPSTAPASTCG